jgi:ribosomal protein S18 acetylase RimI-like enzyme
LLPLLPEEARHYWAQVIADVEQGTRVLLVARQGGQVVGTVQLEPAAKPNAAHRAEVQKLLVHTRARRQGIGRALMQAIEAAALELGHTLLVLDTRKGNNAEQLYRQLGFIRAGEIPRYVRSIDGRLNDTVFFYRYFEGSNS